MPKIKLKKGSSELEIEGEEKYIDKKLEEYDWLIFEADEADEADEAEDIIEEPQIAGSIDIKKIEFGDFFEKINPEKQFEKVITAMYYKTFNEEVKSMSSSDISKLLDVVGEKITSINTVIERSLKKKLIAKDQSNFKLLRKGKQLVEDWLNVL